LNQNIFIKNIKIELGNKLKTCIKTSIKTTNTKNNKNIQVCFQVCFYEKQNNFKNTKTHAKHN